MSTDERPTPETDAAMFLGPDLIQCVEARFASSLERRLAEAEKQLAAKIKMAPVVSRLTVAIIDNYQAELAALRTKLAETERRAADWNGYANKREQEVGVLRAENEMLAQAGEPDRESLLATAESLRKKLHDANADTKRIDWLNCNGWANLLKHGTLRWKEDIRPAIDAAVSKERT